MPLVDHFHPPISRIQSWESFHSRWAGTLADSLSKQLPDVHYLVEVQVTVGSPHLVARVVHTAPAAVRSLDFTFPDDVEVRIHDCRDGKTLIGVIELVSPANKDRPDHRRAFAAKCLTYLHRGIGVVVADIVTERHANLHNELLALLGAGQEPSFPPECHLYAVAYRPARRDERTLLDLWPEALTLDRPLPMLPLALKGGPTIPVDLEAAYSDARRRCRV